jgi:hypothetical protein
MAMRPTVRHPLAQKIEAKDASLRDEFAKFALSGLLAASAGHAQPPDPKQAAHAAYGYADAMMEARQYSPEPRDVG